MGYQMTYIEWYDEIDRQGLPSGRMLITLVAWLVFWLHAFPVAMAASASRLSVPLRVVHGFAVLVPVFIDGIGPYQFLLDTGSTNTSIDRELGRSLGLQPNGEATVETVVGRIPVTIANAQTVSIGPVVEANVEILVRDIEGLRRLDPHIRGVLGQNALMHSNYLLDYKHRTLEFDPDGEVLSSIAGERIALGRLPTPDNPNYTLLTLRADIGHDRVTETTLALDTGTAVLVLFSARTDNAQDSLLRTVQDVTGASRVSESRMIHLTLAGHTRNLETQVVDPRSARHLGGLLPTCIFPGLYVSNAENFVIFAPRISRRRTREIDDDDRAHSSLLAGSRRGFGR